MRVLIVNTSENNGGAAVAANRLMEALKKNGVKAKMLVAEKQTEHVTVAALPHRLLLAAAAAFAAADCSTNGISCVNVSPFSYISTSRANTSSTST